MEGRGWYHQGRRRQGKGQRQHRTEKQWKPQETKWQEKKHSEMVDEASRFNPVQLTQESGNPGSGHTLGRAWTQQKAAEEEDKHTVKPEDTKDHDNQRHYKLNPTQ
ncbi:hypothetical protein NDU88_002876 [Pleurodeles waltl]|uniref:Uncharacterized protein n=1 Tax=Pleurodeles waltl TaxID=8319 RepID=A0AAV7WRH3_PLEWA|nr:hypothetical protein NDU88_002876 [Pleurodeles waltl]